MIIHTLSIDDEFEGWEPIPWDAAPAEVTSQLQGFTTRARKPLVWTKLDFANFPPEGVFGKDRDWFVSRDVAYVTIFEDEHLVLIQNTWFGFPDPPEWGLASRAISTPHVAWSMWGHFPKLPKAWTMPESQ